MTLTCISSRGPKVVLGLLLFFFFASGFHGNNDFLTFYEVARHFLTGDSIFFPAESTGMYVFYLPYFHLLMLPFAFLPFLLASGLWSALKVFALWRLWKLLAPKSENPWFGILPFLILFALILSDFRLGQVNLLILWMLVEASLFQSGKGVLAGSFLCLAAVKIIPLIFLWDWLMERKWKALGFFFIFSAIFWLVTSLWVSLTPLEQIRQFMQMTQVKLSSSEASFFQNQSFLGVGQRLFPGRTGTLLAVAFSMASLLIACLVSFRWAPMNMEERLAIWIPRRH